MNVLIADDDRITREGIQRYIDWDSLGLQVVATAKDGREAFSLLTENEIDILITDIKMPYLSGFELINAIGSKGRFPATIIISGYDDYDYLQRAIKLHIIQGYILKPIQLEHLTQLLREAIDFRREWLQNAQIPESIGSDLRQYSYKDIIVNLQNLEHIYQTISEGDLTQAQELFQQNWDSIIDETKSLNFTKRFAWEIIISLNQILAKDGIDTQDITLGADPLSLVSALENKQAVFRLLADHLENIHLYLQQRGLYQNSKYTYLCTALESRYMDPDLSLQQLAGELDVTANYLGGLYKKERGESFSAILTAKRVQIAKQLLSTSSLKIQEISTRCGFSDPKYFALSFRQATGMTPQQISHQVF